MKKLTKIQASAKGEECTLRIDDYIHEPETVVLCHAPYPGRSGTRKDDWWAAYGCARCHDIVDGRTWKQIPREEMDRFWLRAIHETQSRLIEKGLIKVDGIEPGLPKLLKRR